MELLPEIKEIKKRRTSLGLTQKELSQLSHVSQSLIAKIENQKINVSYKIAKRILETISQLEKNSTKKCKDVMKKKVITLTVDDSLRKAISIMKKKAISQIPILSNNYIVGSISELTIIKAITDIRNKKIKTIKKDKRERDIENSIKIKEIMDFPYPHLSENTEISIAIELLKHYNAVLITDKNKLKGIITKTDVL
ncbi:MAG: CBS domain-containing protein [Nitrospiraceae bacterium]|nr:CBS domain-containing protein [Nitrospiraceae bacterium]